MDATTIIGTVVGLGATGGSGYAIISFWMRLSDRITHADAKAKAAELAAQNANVAVAAAGLEVERLKADLVDHRVDVAKEYVSKDTLASLENRIVEAINRLGDRFDKMLAAR